LKLKLKQPITSRLFSVVGEMLNLTIGPILIPKTRKVVLQERITLCHLFEISLNLLSAVLLVIARDGFVSMRYWKRKYPYPKNLQRRRIPCNS